MMPKPENLTLFIPDDKEKERLIRVCNKIKDMFFVEKMPDYEVAFVMRELVESFQTSYSCYIPIYPNKVHVIAKFTREDGNPQVQYSGSEGKVGGDDGKDL